VSAPVLALRGVGKSFGAVCALDDVTVDIRAGEVLALVGDNGAGKSTLVRCLAGIHAPDTGSILCDGVEVALRTPAEARKLGVETVHQDLALCDNLDVVANLFLGREVTRGGRLDEDAMEARTREVLAELSIGIPDVRTPVGMLSGGQRQCVAVARAMAWKPRVVLLDEPTAALGVAQTAQVLDLVLRLRERGLAVVLISHNMADVKRVATRIMVMRLGRCVAMHDANAVDAARVVADITGAHA
jgi:D-xylose transport system ATP-binding protein